MTNPAGRIFDFEQMNAIRDAHRDWCASHSLDPASPAGQEFAALMFDAFRSGRTGRAELLSACDDYQRQRAEQVRLGSPPIDSRS